jgi:hypothetical protein
MLKLCNSPDVVVALIIIDNEFLITAKDPQQVHFTFLRRQLCDECQHDEHFGQDKGNALWLWLWLWLELWLVSFI